MPTDVLIIGLGGIGGWMLELLARSGEVASIVGADVNAEWGRKRLRTAAAGAALQGHYPHLEFAELDLQQIDQTAATISRLQPRLIANCATLQTWWVRSRGLPPEVAARLGQAGAGPWLSTHLALARKLMLAVRASGWQGHVINSGFSDCGNLVLARRGMEPTIGLGNIDLLVPIIQLGAARRLQASPRNVAVYAVMHHHHYGSFQQRDHDLPEYFLRIMHGDRDVTDRFDTGKLVHEAVQDYLPGEHLNPVVAASGAKNALALLMDRGLITHSPGPKGLPGGYPIRLDGAGAEVYLPAGLTLEQAVAINLAAQRADGIERVENDGTVVYTDQAIQIFREVLDYALPPLEFDNCDEYAAELIGHLKALTK